MVMNPDFGHDDDMEEISESTRSFFACVIDGPFDHQRDAYEQGWDDGAAAAKVRFMAWLRHRGYRILADELAAEAANAV